MTTRKKTREELQRAFELLTREALTRGVTEVMSRHPTTRYYLDRYGEAGVANAIIDHAKTHNVWTPFFLDILFPDGVPPRFPDEVPAGAARDEEEEPDDTTAAENQEEPDEWLCPACGNSPCEFLQAQPEIERLVGQMAPETTAKAKRFQMYRHLTRNLHGQLSKKQRIPLPPCCAQGLRDLFPSDDGAYTGFKIAK
jgi:rubredoxin